MLSFGHGCETFNITNIMPRVMESIGYWKAAASLMITSTYVAACICCFLVSYSSLRRGEHGYHVAFSLFIALSRCIRMLTLSTWGNIAIYASVTTTFANNSGKSLV